MDRGALGESRLRSMAEDVVVTATAPVHEAMEALEELSDAAAALVGTGSVESDVADGIVSETIDALVVRGAEWIAPAVPDLDVEVLVAAARTGPTPELWRIVPSARAGAGEVASVELWSDRCVVRFFGGAGGAGMGGPAPARELPPVERNQRHLEVQWETLERTEVALDGGRDAGQVEVNEHRIEPSAYLRRLASHLAATAIVETSLDGIEALRRRLAVSARILDEPPTSSSSLLAAFDRTVTGVVPEWSVPEEAIAIAARGAGLSLLSVERWSDHWRLFLSGAPRGEGRFWTAEVDSSDGGDSYGGVWVGDDRIDFFPALPPSWRRLSLELIDAGRCHSFEVRR